MSSPDFFHGKTAVITGAASGVGRATSLIFLREGANVVGLDVNPEGLGELERETGLGGARFRAIVTDITSREAVDEAVATAEAEFGGVDFLFNSAGAAFRRSPFMEIDDELMERTFALNFTGSYYTMQAVIPGMLERGHGVSVNVASMAHKRGGPGSSIHYAAAKGAVLSMTLGVAREFASRGIRALSVSPTSINTPFQATANSSPEFVQQFMNDIPMKRFAEPEEIGELVLFLCSDKCEFMTADTVYVSGGSGYR